MISADIGKVTGSASGMTSAWWQLTTEEQVTDQNAVFCKLQVIKRHEIIREPSELASMRVDAAKWLCSWWWSSDKYIWKQYKHKNTGGNGRQTNNALLTLPWLKRIFPDDADDGAEDLNFLFETEDFDFRLNIRKN